MNRWRAENDENEDLKPEQEESLRNFIEEKDIICVLSMSFGKSLM